MMPAAGLSEAMQCALPACSYAHAQLHQRAIYDDML